MTRDVPESAAVTATSPVIRLVREGRRMSLQFSMLILTVATVVITALAVHLPWAMTAETNVGEMIRLINREISAGIKQQVDDLFKSAIRDQQAAAEMIRAGIVDLSSESARDIFFLSFLKGRPHYSFFAIGTREGNYFGAARVGEHNLLGVTSRWDEKAGRAARSERKYVGDGHVFAPSGSVTQVVNDYFAPGRIWFKQALEAVGKDQFTEPYIFASSGKIGVNSSLAVERGGAVLGVVTIAIELERLSAYLRGIGVGKTGVAFVVNGAGQIVASSDPRFATAREGGEARLPDIGSAEAPLIRVAGEILQRQGVALERARQAMEFAAEVRGERYVLNVDPVGYRDWVVATVIPESDFSGSIEHNNRRMLAVLLAVIVVTCIGVGMVIRWLLLKPIEQVIAQTRHIEQFHLNRVATVESRIIEVDSLSESVKRMSLGLASFGKYLPMNLVQRLIASGMEAELSAEKRTMTIFFIDLAGFTSITEAIGPRMLPALSLFLDRMGGEIERHRGTIDKYIGDAIMAFWGAPDYSEDHATLACRAALDCLAQLETLREAWPEEWRERLSARIGLNSGRVVVGNIGSASRLNYTVIGDPVNLASRLEATCKDYGVRCIIGKNTYELARYDIVVRPLGDVVVKGRAEPIEIYELLAMRDDGPDAADFAWVDVFAAALGSYRERAWSEARAGFLRVIELRGDDPPSRVFIGRCDQHLADPETA